ALAFSPDGKWLATGSVTWSDTDKAGEIKVFDLSSRKEKTGASWARQHARTLAFTPDSKSLVVGSFGSNGLKFFDMKTGRLHRTVTGANSVRAIAFSPDGKFLASTHGIGSAHGTGSIQVWDANTLQEVMALTGHTTLA